MSVLRVIRSDEMALDWAEILVKSERGMIRVKVEEREVPLPLISLLLHHHYVLGALVDAGKEIGTQVSASLSFIRNGQLVALEGVVVPLIGGPLLVVPIGFFVSENKRLQVG